MTHVAVSAPNEMSCARARGGGLYTVVYVSELNINPRLLEEADPAEEVEPLELEDDADEEGTEHLARRREELPRRGPTGQRR